ncbi:MAG TPA: tripartite tricarboxylate transporter substrate binding protein [Burkholderiales bacterium]
MKISGFMLGLLALLMAGSAAAQTHYPEKPIHLVVGFPPGSPPDTFARLFGQRLTGTWSEPVLIENVTGAAGNIAADRVAKAAPDGYTLGVLTEAQIVVNPGLYALAYDPVRDFAPVSQLFASPNLLVVSNAVPAKSLEELVALAKAQPGALTFVSGGSGSTAHMAGELFKSAAGIDIRHVPYKGVLAAMPDLLGGRVTMVFSPMAIVLPMVREGKLRALAVTSLKRSAAAPELPTIAESGYPGFEVAGWNGLLAPAKTPAAVVRALNVEAVKALAHPEIRAKLDGLGLQAIGSSPDQFAAVIASQIPKWTKVIRDAGIKAD